MLEFYYDCVDKYLSRDDFIYCERDNDSAYMAISGDSFEELIKSELREEFENDKHNWFVTPLPPQGKRTPGLLNPFLPGLLNTLQTWGGVFYPPPNSLVFYPRSIKFSM